MSLHTDVYPLRVWQPTHGNRDPRIKRECTIRTAADLLTETPTLPSRRNGNRADVHAYDLRSHHCAFRGCFFECESAKDLENHLLQEHPHALLSVPTCPHARHLSNTHDAGCVPNVLRDVDMPLPNVRPRRQRSLDRRCLRRFRENFSQRHVGAAMWNRVLQQQPDKLEALLGFQRYGEQYVASLGANTRTAFREELGTWTCQVACPGFAVTLLACLEDKVCDGPHRCPANRMCAHCRVPVCVACCDALYRHGQKPAEALTNDMMLGYPPRDLYALQCTVLEVLSASPCLTALTCFSIEWRYLSDRSLAQDAFMNRHRLCAKGNATNLSVAVGRSFV